MVWVIGTALYITFTTTIMAILTAASKDDDLFNRDEIAWLQQQELTIKEKLA